MQANAGTANNANVTTVAISCSMTPVCFYGCGGNGALPPVSSDSTLSNLALSSGSLSPSFSASTGTYTASVSYDTTSITVTPTKNQTNAIIKVNGAVVASGTASGSISLNLGANTITTIVTAQDGTNTSTYTVTVTRLLNTATTITSFDLNGLSPAVTGTVNNTAHTVLLTVPYATTVTALTPTIVLATGATISPNSGVAQDFTNPVTYTVTAQNGTTTQTYTVTVSTFNYYVDSVNGNDSNDGLTASTAFRTLAAATTAVGSGSNKAIGLAKGSTWKEQLILSNNTGAIVASYGSGSMPLIDAGDTIPASSFSLASGQTVTYQASLTFTGSTGTEQRLIWENNANLVQVSSIASVESTAGSFFYSNYTSSSATVYIHAKDGSNPGSNGKTYDYTNRYNAISITGDNCRVDGIRTRRQRDNNGSIEIFGDNCTIANGIAEDGHKHLAYMQEGSTVQNYVFKNAYNGTDNFPNYLVFNKNVGTGLNNVVTGSTFTTDPTVVPASGGIVTQFPTSVISHTNTSGSFGTLTASNNTHSQTSGYQMANAGNQSISGDTFTNCTIVGTTADAVTVSISSITVTNPLNVSTSFGLFKSSNPASGRVAVTYTGITVNSGTNLIQISGNNLDSTFTNSSITAGDTSSRAPQGLLRISGTGNTLTVNGTTITQTVAAATFYNLATDTTYVGNNNTFVRPSGAYNFRRNSTVVATTISAWQTYSGQDANSTGQ